jgi:SPP1 gp7 family putative phage head morphogenesis protein
MDKVNPQYRKMMEQIAQDNQDYADDEMKPVYKEQKKSLDIMEALIGTLFVKYAVEGLLNLNITQKADISANIDKQLIKIGKDLGQNEVNKVSDILKNVYKTAYYESAFCLDEGMSITLKFDLLKKEFIDRAVNSKLAGELFSDRIWKNKSDMIDLLKQKIVDCMKGDTTIDKIAREIRDTFSVQAYESKRLVITEVTRVQSQASIDIAKNTGIEKHMWSATLDTHTCDDCAANDNKIFDIDDDNAPEIPLHSNDRCCWINIPENWTPTKRKDNETKQIIDYVSYDEWQQSKGIE